MTAIITRKVALLIAIFWIAIYTKSATAELKVVAYQKYNTMARFDPNSFQYMDQLIYKLIRVEADGELQLLKSTISDLRQLIQYKTDYPEVELLIGVGGAKRNSEHFPVMAKSVKARTHFINNLVEFCQQFKLDGVDLDWEYPKTEEQKRHAQQLFKQAKRVFDNKGLKLTAAVNYSPDQVLFAKSIEPYVQQINLMVYEPIEGLTSFQQQIDFGNRLVAEKGLNRKKLVMGLPFYGRNFESNEFQRYYQLLEAPLSQMSYLNRAEIKRNTQAFLKSGYLGVMFWELGFDAKLNSKQSLLRQIHQVAKR